MKVYHGTNLVVDKPQIVNRFKTLDFGEGFYTTENESQAREFAVKVCARREPSLSPIVNCYEFADDDSTLSILRFDAPDEGWLDFVVANRKGTEPIRRYDVIIGPVANDDVFGTIILYEAGQLDRESAIKRFRIKKLYNQVVFCTDAALGRLTFVESYTVEDEI